MIVPIASLPRSRMSLRIVCSILLAQPVPPDPAQAGGAVERWWLVAVEELVDRAVRSDVEVLSDVVLERRPVRAGPVRGEGEGAVHHLAVLVEAAPDGELAGVAGQAWVLQRHGDKVPVWVKVAWMRPSSKVVVCSMRLLVDVMV